MPRIRWGVKNAGRAAARAGWPERGQSLAVMALMLVALLSFLALVIDLGNVYAQRRLMQGAADAAALAGVRRLALGLPYTAIDGDVQEYACARNGAESYGLQVEDESIVVSVSKVCDLFFAPVIGFHEMTVGAVAEAGYGLPGSWKGDLMPIAVHIDAIRNACLDDCVVDIWDDAVVLSDPAAGVIGDGQRGWLNFNGGEVSNTELVTWCLNGYNEKVYVDTWINGTSGTKTAAMQAIEDVRVGHIIVLPVYDDIRPGENGNGKIDYHIVTFAEFHVDGVVDTGTPKYVRGTFLREVAAQEAGGTVDAGVRVISLQ